MWPFYIRPNVYIAVVAVVVGVVAIVVGVVAIVVDVVATLTYSFVMQKQLSKPDTLSFIYLCFPFWKITEIMKYFVPEQTSCQKWRHVSIWNTCLSLVFKLIISFKVQSFAKRNQSYTFISIIRVISAWHFRVFFFTENLRITFVLPKPQNSICNLRRLQKSVYTSSEMLYKRDSCFSFFFFSQRTTFRKLWVCASTARRPNLFSLIMHTRTCR